MASFWKIMGPLIGFIAGGRTGASIGLALGYAEDTKTEIRERILAKERAQERPSTRLSKEEKYQFSCIILSAKLAECDAPTNRAEMNAFKKRFPIPKEKAKIFALAFDKARKNVDDYDSFAQEISTVYKKDPQALEQLLSLLFAVARADLAPGAHLTPEEEKFLLRVHRVFGLDRAAWHRAEQDKTPISLLETQALFEQKA